MYLAHHNIDPSRIRRLMNQQRSNPLKQPLNNGDVIRRFFTIVELLPRNEAVSHCYFDSP